MKRFILVAAAAVSLGSVSAAHAAASIGGSLGFTPDVTINFEQAAQSASLDTAYASSGVTFTNIYQNYIYAGSFPPDLSGGAGANFVPGNAAANFTIDFAAPQADAAFAIVSNTPATISTYLGGNLVESVTYAGGYRPGADIVQFTNSKFDSIHYSGTNDLAALIDNLAFASGVPEPATWAMLILGVAMVGFAARRRHGQGAALLA